MEKISIVIPVYNVERYLSECLNSIVDQDYTNWEAILVDDGSTDQSGSICDAYAQNDKRFVVIHQENKGAACAKNTGLDHVSGEFVAFIDSDDYIDSDWLQISISTAKKYKADVVEFGFDKVYKNKNERICLCSNLTTFSAESYLAQYVENWTSSLFTNKIFRSELVKNVRFNKERRCIDDEFFTYKVLSDARIIIRIPRVFYHYRQRISSAIFSHKNQQQIANDSLDVLIERYLWICSRYPNLRKIYLYHDVNILFYFSTFCHTNLSVKKFCKNRRFYLFQVLLHPAGISLIKNIIRLQFISKKSLKIKRIENENKEKIEDYFE